MISLRRTLALTLVIVIGGRAAPLFAQAPASAQATAPVTEASPAGARRSPFAEIAVTALTETDAVMARAPIRLRDTRNGRVTSVTRTDETGHFNFRTVEAGNYVVELVGDRERVLAASPLITVAAGDTVSTIVRLPLKRIAHGGLLGGNAAAASIVAATAAAAGVLSVRVGNCVSPPCEN